MTEDQKQEIYTLLRTAARNVYGYTPEKFENDVFISPVKQEPVPVSISAKETPSVVPEAVSPKPAISVSPVTNSTNPSPAPSTQSTVQSPAPNPAPGVTQGLTQGLTMGEIIYKIARCTRCSLARTRMNTVPGIGVKNPEVMIIGEAPSMEENSTGLPLMGNAGQLLEKMLDAIRLKRDLNCYMTNTVKCMAPPNRGPSTEEIASCSGYLEAQIKVLKPKMILCAGRLAAITLLKNNNQVNLSQNIESLHGKWFDYNGIPLFVIHNPNEVLHNPNLKKPVWDDLRNFAARLKETSSTYAALFNS